MQNQGYRGSRWRAVATLLCYWCLRGSRAKPEQGANAERGKNTNQGGAAGDGDAAALSGPLGTGDGHCVVSERAYLVDGTPELESTNLKVAFLTHLHSDHTAGYPSLLFVELVPLLVGHPGDAQAD